MSTYCTVQEIAQELREDVIRGLTEVTINAATIAAVDGGASADSFTDSGNGLAVFAAGNPVQTHGFDTTANNGTFDILTVAAGTITVPTGSLTAESAGAAVQLTASDYTGSPTWSSTTVSQCIDTASGMIDSYLAVRYELPLSYTTTPQTLVAVCTKLAIYRLYARGVQGVPTNVKDEYDEAKQWLKDVAAGRAALGVMDGAEVAQEIGTVQSTSDQPRIHQIRATDATPATRRDGISWGGF